MLTLRRVGMFLAVGLLIAGPVALTAALVSSRENAQKPTMARTVELPSAELAGKVSYPDGQAVETRAPVRVWSREQARFIYETTTGEEGTYRLPALQPGRYQVVFADRVRVALVVTAQKAQKPTVLDVVIPHGTAVFAQMPVEQKAAVLSALAAPAAAEGNEPPEESSGLLPAVVIGGGGLSAVAILADSQDWFEGDRRHVNSP